MVVNEPIVNALSFDIEDWFHMVEIDAVSDPRTWDELPSIVERYTDWIVETVTKANVHATFFVLGWIADRHPDLVKRIADEHGFSIEVTSERGRGATFEVDLGTVVTAPADPGTPEGATPGASTPESPPRRA